MALINLAIRLPSKQHPLAKLAFRELLDIAQQGNLEDCVEIKRLVAVLVAYDAFDVAFAVTYRTVADEQRAEILLSIAHTLIKDNDRRITVVFDALEKTIPYVQDSLRQLSLWGQLVEVAICVGDEQLNRVWNTFKTQMHQIRDMWVIEYAESLLGMIASALAKAHRFEEAKTVSSEINDPGRRELVLADLADELMNAGFVPEASDIVRKIRTSGAKVSTLCHLGIALAQNGNSRDAEAIWDEVQKIANRIDEPEKQGSALRDIACALGEISRYREAEEFARQIPNRQGQAATLARLAPALAKIGDERAGILFEEARAIQAEPQDVYPQISALIRTAVGLREVDANLANRVYSKAKEALELIAGSWQYEDLARDLTVALAEAGYFAEAETTASRIKDYWNRTCALNALAAALARVGDTHAQFIAHAATVFGNNIPDDWGRSRSLSYEASMLASRREHQAQALFDEARIATDGISNENRRAEALRMIVEAMTQSGFLEKARETALSIQGEETKKRALSCIAALTGDFVRALNILGVCSLDVFLYEIATWTFAVERLKTELSPELMMAVCRIAGWTRPDLLDMYRLLVSS